MPPKTVQQLFNLKPEEVNALTVLSGLEGYRGGRGEDAAAVAANVLARRLAGNWGGVDIRNIAKSPGQYEAVFDYSMQQLADPAFGAQKLGAKLNIIASVILLTTHLWLVSSSESLKAHSLLEAYLHTDAKNKVTTCQYLVKVTITLIR
jgi:hypothetical protein